MAVRTGRPAACFACRHQEIANFGKLLQQKLVAVGADSQQGRLCHRLDVWSALINVPSLPTEFADSPPIWNNNHLWDVSKVVLPHLVEFLVSFFYSAAWPFLSPWIFLFPQQSERASREDRVQ